MAKVSASQDASPSRARLDTETRPFSSPRVDESAWLVPTLTVLCHPQTSRVGERAVLTELASGQRVELSRLGPLFAQPDSTAEPRPLADVHVSRRPLALVPGAGPGEVRLIPPPGGAALIELDGEALDRPRSLGLPELERGLVLMLAERVVLLLHLGDPVSADPVPAAPSELGAKPAGGDLGFVGESPAMARVRRQVRRVADLEVPVLVRGPTGAGKELVAAALHRVGPRRAAPLVAVNMAAIPPELAAAELFGAEPGAFTGARRRRRGHFQRADRATLFLDEIGDAPSDVQALLLRALETGEVRPLGGESAERVDVRLIAATDAALEEAVEAGHFREPLLHRL
ncbi:MAG: sigma-54 factor interaction domain-containing protein, partial [Acidobacteriota bacterium]